MDAVDKYMEDILAMMTGKGKGRGDIICYNCGKTGHMAKDCWASPKGGGKGGKDGGKGNYGKMNYGKPTGNYFGKSNDKGKFGGKGNTKGGPKGGCWVCGGNHYSSECPRMKGRGGKGINGVDGQEETSKDESV